LQTSIVRFATTVRGERDTALHENDIGRCRLNAAIYRSYRAARRIDVVGVVIATRSADVRTCVAFLLETVEFLPSWKPHELVGLVQGRRVARTGTRARRILATCRDCPSLSSILFYFYLITRLPGDHIVHTRFSCVPRREIGIFAEICRKARITFEFIY